MVANALVLFSINLTINIARLTLSLYENYCTAEYRMQQCIIQAQEQFNIWVEVAHLAQLTNQGNQ